MKTDPRKVLADLRVQAIIFDMNVDIETGSLEQRRKDQVPIWIKKWREKEHGSDRNPEDYEGGRDERG